MEKELTFLEEIELTLKDLTRLDPEEADEMRREEDMAWVMVAKKRGHGLSQYESQALNI